MRKPFLFLVASASFLLASPAGADGSMVRVHIESDRPVRLESDEYGDWAAVCDSPCDRDLPLGVDYRIAGDDVRRSRPFRLQGRVGTEVRLDVSTSTKAVFTTGIVMTSAGPAVAAAMTVAAIGYSLRGDDRGANIATGIAVAGLATTAVGLTLLLLNLHSSAEQRFDWPATDGASVRF